MKRKKINNENLQKLADFIRNENQDYYLENNSVIIHKGTKDEERLVIFTDEETTEEKSK